MYCRRATLATTILAICAACGRQPAKPPTPRIAILRFENLSADRAANWMGRALSEIISAELASAPDIYAIPSSQVHLAERQTGVRPISAPGISAERGLALIAGATRVGYGEFYVRDGRLHARLTLEDADNRRTVGVWTAEAGTGDIAAVASTLARQITPAAGTYGTRNAAALEAYATALEGGESAQRAEWAARAIAADPNFGSAYQLLAAIKAGQQDVPGALAVLADAAKRGDALPAAERARIAFESASLRGDTAGRADALAGLVKATPGDIGAWRSLGELSYNARDYGRAVSAYEKLLTLVPDDTAALNQIGYAYASQGNLERAVASLQRYAALRPSDANALDSTGDVYLMSGRLAEAGNAYLEAFRKDPNLQGSGSADLFKAAMAKLMAGDIPGADALEKQFDEARGASHDAAVPFRQAEWLWLSGRRKEAYRDLTLFAQGAQGGALKELASRAYSELALWSLMLGDGAGAQQMIAKAAQLAGPNSAGTVVLVRFLAQPPASPAEWATRAGALFRERGQESMRDLWLGYALLLGKQFDAAIPVVRRLYDAGGDESLPVLLAWAYVEAGRTDDAAPLLRFNPIPPIGGIGLFTSWYFPRLYYLRAALAEKQGRSEEARANRQLFLKLSGPTTLAWGEEQKARQAP